jgi:hypothetical protein
MNLQSKRREFFRSESKPFNRLDIIIKWLIEHHHMEWCNAYGEPGYHDPETGVLFADWNNIPKAFQTYLEHQGYELEWSDEWVIDYDHSKAYRTKPDGYDWEPSTVFTDDGELLTPDDGADAVINALAMTDRNQPVDCVPSWVTPDDLEAEGYERFPADAEAFEAGYFPGQNDDPGEIAKRAFDAGDVRVERVVFRMVENSQFYCKFECWRLLEESD